jgi:hypothetical protein
MHGGGREPSLSEHCHREQPVLIFSLEPANLFARSLADALDVALSPHEEHVFEDGERKLRPQADRCSSTP